MNRLSTRLLALAATMIAVPAFAQFTESEANDSKAAANIFTGLSAGSTITGNSTGSSTTVPGPDSADYFRVSTAASSLAVYQHRLTIESATPGHTGTIRGLTQTNGTINAGTDSGVQTSSATTSPPRFNQWYGFGRAEELYYRVTGTASTTADYVATLSTTVITPTNLGSFQPGTINISTVGRTNADTSLIVLDGSFNPISGFSNDDEPSPGTSLQSSLTRTFAAGTYYLAISNFNLTNSQSSAPDDGYDDSSRLDFPDAIVNSSTTINVDLDFGITDSLGTLEVSALKTDPYQVLFYEFEVVPEPGTMAALGLGLAALARRKRARK